MRTWPGVGALAGERGSSQPDTHALNPGRATTTWAATLPSISCLLGVGLQRERSVRRALFTVNLNRINRHWLFVTRICNQGG